MIRKRVNTTWLPTLRLLWPRSIYVTRVTLYMTKYINVTKFAPCTATPPCTKDRTKYCRTCNRYFLSKKCFQNHLTLKVKSKLVCQWKQVCPNCSYLVKGDAKHECNKRFCYYCNKKQPSDHFCYVATLTPSKLSDKYMYVFFDTKCTQDLTRNDGTFGHIPNLICVQQMCSECQSMNDMETDCEQCRKPTRVLGGTSRQIYWLSPAAQTIHGQDLSFPTILEDTTHSFYCAGFWNWDGYLN
jgi:hypothetical protein